MDDRAIARGTASRLLAGALATVAGATLLLAVGLLTAAPASAAAPAQSITPFVDCYFDNGDGTVTFSLGYTSRNASTVTVDAGADNRVVPTTLQGRQPTSFASGTHRGAWAPTVRVSDLSPASNWYLTGNAVQLSALTPCATKPVPVQGSSTALLVLLGVSAGAGGLTLGAHRARTLRPGRKVGSR